VSGTEAIAARRGDQRADPIERVLEIPRLIPLGLARHHQASIRVEPVTAHRAPNVAIFDMRLDKSFRFAGHRVTAMADVFNLTNSGVPVTFRTASAVSFQEVTALLDPRIVRLGLRFEF